MMGFVGVIAMLVILESWIWLERVKIQGMERSRCVYQGWNVGDGINRVLMGRFWDKWAAAEV